MRSIINIIKSRISTTPSKTFFVLGWVLLYSCIWHPSNLSNFLHIFFNFHLKYTKLNFIHIFLIDYVIIMSIYIFIYKIGINSVFMAFKILNNIEGNENLYVI